jgi:hypothetical protein
VSSITLGNAVGIGKTAHGGVSSHDMPVKSG